MPQASEAIQDKNNFKQQYKPAVPQDGTYSSSSSSYTASSTKSEAYSPRLLPHRTGGEDNAPGDKLSPPVMKKYHPCLSDEFFGNSSFDKRGRVKRQSTRLLWRDLARDLSQRHDFRWVLCILSTVWKTSALKSAPRAALSWRAINGRSELVRHKSRLQSQFETKVKTKLTLENQDYSSSQKLEQSLGTA